VEDAGLLPGAVDRDSVMRYLSVCSGIEAASVAWKPLGWQAVAFAEVEAFPSAVLKHHYPIVPNRGDMTKFREWDDTAFDVLVGGTPCQSFSVAGLRAGLADPRGNLALTYLAVTERYRPRWLVWENVPGVLSSTSHDAPDLCPPAIDLDTSHGPADGEEVVVTDRYDADESHAFACFLAGLSELGYGWAYGSLDAQHFGVAQRRLRVFVVGHLGGWPRPAAALLERHSLSWSDPPRRSPRHTGTLSSRASAGGGLGTDFDLDGGVIVPDIVPQAMSAKWAKGSSGPAGDEVANLVVHTLKADGFDASEDGTGRGTPIIATTAPTLGQRMRGQIDSMCDGALVSEPITLAIRGRGDSHDLEYRQDGTANAVLTPNGGRGGIGVGAIAFDTTQITHPENRSNPQPDGPSPSLAKGAHPPAIAFCAKDHGADAGELAPTLRAGGHHKSHANGGVMPAVAFSNTAGDTALGMSKPGVPPLTRRNGDPGNVLLGMQVRRLTPRECERLQGFPDDYTRIPVRRSKRAPSAKRLAKYPDLYEQNADGTWTQYAEDGPRYKALGNSMAVPVMRWIGQRIALVEAL
jgi:DNA (cytosine-5)-methyltransferase 1